MGWCSATEIFDSIVGHLIGDSTVPVEKVIENLVTSFEDADWDCQQDSDYYDHPVVRRVFVKLHPDWFEKDELVGHALDQIIKAAADDKLSLDEFRTKVLQISREAKKSVGA